MYLSKEDSSELTEKQILDFSKHELDNIIKKYKILISLFSDENKLFIEPIIYNYDYIPSYNIVFNDLIYEIFLGDLYQKFKKFSYCLLYKDDIIYKSSNREYNHKKYDLLIDDSINELLFTIIFQSDFIIDIIDSCKIIIEKYILNHLGKMGKYNLYKTSSSYCDFIEFNKNKTRMKIELYNNNKFLLKHNENYFEIILYKIIIDLYKPSELLKDNEKN